MSKDLKGKVVEIWFAEYSKMKKIQVEIQASRQGGVNTTDDKRALHRTRYNRRHRGCF